MALGTDILRLLVQADVSGAVNEFQKLGKGIEDSGDKAATGFKGKLTQAFDGLQSKSGAVSGIFEKIGLSSGQAAGAIATTIPLAAAAAAGGLVAFAVKGVKAFQDTALAAGKFADASGLSVESASRYIAVADDIGVGADTIQNAFIKMEKAMGTNKAAFGDLIATTKSGGTDLDQTFLNAIKHLQGIKDPIERATESSKLFGKGFSEVSQIIGTNADTLKTKLAAVSDAQVINQKELQNARHYQEAMDRLGDSVGDVQREVGGQLVPALADAANGFALGIEKASEFGIRLSPLVSNAEALTAALGPFAVLGSLMDNSVTGIGKIAGALDGVDLSKLAAGTVDAGGFGNALETAAAKANDLKTKWDLLRGSLSIKDAQLSLEDGFAAVGKAAEEAWAATSSGAADASAKVNDHKQSVTNLEQKVVDYGEKVLNLPPEQVTDILAKIDEGDLAGAKAALDKAAEARTAAFKAKEDTGATSAVEKAFENTARTRSSLMKANAETGDAEGALNSTARSRAASIAASAQNVGEVNRQLDNAARDRTAIIRAVGAGSVPYLHADGRFYDKGGMVPGPKGQAQPAIVHGGEYVLSGDVVDRIKKGRQSSGAGMGPGSLSVGSASGGSVIQITVNGAVDPYNTARQIQRILAQGTRGGFNTLAA